MAGPNRLVTNAIKIERYHRSMKNVVKAGQLLPWRTGSCIRIFVHYYNHATPESLSNVTPADVYYGRQEEILSTEKRIKLLTLKRRRQDYLKAKSRILILICNPIKLKTKNVSLNQETLSRESSLCFDDVHGFLIILQPFVFFHHGNFHNPVQSFLQMARFEFPCLWSVPSNLSAKPLKCTRNSIGRRCQQLT